MENIKELQNKDKEVLRSFGMEEADTPKIKNIKKSIKNIGNNMSVSVTKIYESLDGDKNISEADLIKFGNELGKIAKTLDGLRSKVLLRK